MSLTPDIERVLSAVVNERVPHDDWCCAKGCAGEGFCAGCSGTEDDCRCTRREFVALIPTLAEQIAALVEQREETTISAFLDTLPPHIFSEHAAQQIREWADEWRQG